MDENLTLKRTQKRMNRRIKTIILCVVIIAIIVMTYIAGSLISDDAVAADFSKKNLPPALTHPFGTDWLGRDMFLRTIRGLSISITVGTIASVVSVLIAIVIGIALVMGVPHLVLLILIAFVCGRGLAGLLVGIAVTHWTSLARLIRVEVLQIRSQQYIAVSRKLGHSSRWILIYHILPHMIPQIVIGLVLLFPHAILHESSLSFLGYGLPPEQPAVGIILSESMKYLSSGMWWLAIFPGITLVIIVVLFDKLGDNLKILLDPHSAHE